MIDRRIFLASAAGLAVSRPSIVRAQIVGRPARIGVVSLGKVVNLPLFREALTKHGHVDGKSIILEERDAEGDVVRLPVVVEDLLRIPVDAFFAVALPALTAVRAATKTVPTVAFAADLLGTGGAGNLSRPAGNVTGVEVDVGALNLKQAELLKETLPNLTRLAVVHEAGVSFIVDRIAAMAPALHVEILRIPIGSPADLDAAINAELASKVQAVMLTGGTFLNHNAARAAGLARLARIPLVSYSRLSAEAGALFAYGWDQREVFGRCAAHLDRILKGAKISDIPIELPGKFEFILNLKTAKELGINLPPSILLRANEVIE